MTFTPTLRTILAAALMLGVHACSSHSDSTDIPMGDAPEAGASGEGGAAGDAGEAGANGEAGAGGESGANANACMMIDLNLDSAEVIVNPGATQSPTWALQVGTADETSFLSIESWSNFDGPTGPGTFNLEGINYADCGLCVLVYADCTDDECDTVYYAQQGIVEIESVDLANGGEVTVNLSDVVLTEVSISMNFVSTPVANARTICADDGYTAMSPEPPPALTDGAGEQLPEFSGTDQNGDTFASASLAGTMSLIVMNAGDWCPPCQQFAEDSEDTLRALKEADSRYDVSMVQIMISNDEPDVLADQASVTAWAEATGITTMPVIFGDEDGNLAPLWALLEERIARGQLYVPSYWIVDPLGQIRFFGGSWRFPDDDEDPLGPLLELMDETFGAFLADNPDWVDTRSTEPGEGDGSTDMVDPCEGIVCEDGVSCTSDTCVDGVCTQSANDAACDDGQFCNGQETCDVDLGCAPGVAPCSGTQTCNEDTDTCEG